jgi:hypothetical protein
MLDFFKKDSDLNIRVRTLELEIKNIYDELAKIDIKAMEAQKTYRSKLKRFIECEEQPKKEKNINDSIFLNENGLAI